MERPLPLRIAGSLLAAACVMAACSLASQEPTTRLATIVRIEEPQGEFISPRIQGPFGQLTKIYLRPAPEGAPRPGLMVVAVLGPFRPALFGKPGDVVSITYPGPIPHGAEIPFEDLIGYEVVQQAGKPRG